MSSGLYRLHRPVLHSGWGVFINPGFFDKDNPTGGFWNSVSAFMQAAAKELNIDPEIIYCDRNHIKIRRMAALVIADPSLPDYLIVVNEKLSVESVESLMEDLINGNR